MTTNHDVTRIVRSWLHEEEHESADRVLALVMAELDTTPQRRAWWPAWRFPFMNTYAKLALAAAGVLAIAVIGINLLPGGQPGPGGAATTAAPSTPVSPPAATPSPAASPAFTFPQGTLGAGPQTAEVLGIPFTFEAPGWFVRAGDLPVIQRSTASGSFVWIAFWDPTNLYVWPCAAQPLDPPAGPTTAELVTALEQIRGMGRTAPTELQVDERPATYVEMTVLPALDCDVAPLAYVEEADGDLTRRIVSPPGTTVRTWIVDVDGIRFLIDSDQVGDDPALAAEVQAIVDSIRFE